MSVLDTVKEVASIAQKIDNLDLLKRLVELQEQVYELLRDNQALKERIATQAELRFDKNAYWRGADGPFCSRCWDVDARLVRLHGTYSRGTFTCPNCTNTATDIRPEQMHK